MSDPFSLPEFPKEKPPKEEKAPKEEKPGLSRNKKIQIIAAMLITFVILYLVGVSLGHGSFALVGSPQTVTAVKVVTETSFSDTTTYTCSLVMSSYGNC
jgi:cell division septal protein FtsQ